MYDGVDSMTEGGPRFRRDPAEIAAIMNLRAKRAIDHVTGMAWGRTARLCPICGYQGMFSPVKHKPEIWCPSCDSRPRHRLLKLWMDREMVLGPGARVLHFAAEPWVRGWFEDRGATYVTADINDLFDLKIDITAMDLPDACYDMVMSNHVLEHVDDTAALAEMFRVLKRGGQAVISVPMIEGWDATHEDPALATEAARRLHYGDPSHLRVYGRDVRDRIRAEGFALHEYVAVEPDVSTHALHRGERIFVGLKPAAEGATDG